MPVMPIYDRGGIADDVDTLASYIRTLGGNVLEGTKRFQFEIPLSEVKRIIPEINKHKLSCQKVGERQDHDINGRACSVARIEVSREREKSDYDHERGLMWAVCRQIDK